MSSASAFELWWTGLGVPGLLLFVYILVLSIGDWRHVAEPLPGVPERRALGARLILAVQHIAVALFLFGGEFLLTLAGVAAMLTPARPGSPPPTQISRTGLIILLGLVGSRLFSLGIGVAVLVARKRLMNKVEADREFLAQLRARVGVEEVD